MPKSLPDDLFDTWWRWYFRHAAICALAMVLLCATVDCSSVPRRHLWNVEKGVTFTDLQQSPERYQGKTVILGGVIVHDENKDGRLWLRMKNRPLDDNQRPHLADDPDSSESGYYWVAVEAAKIPDHYHDWAQVTVVGRVVPTQSGVKSDPVLAAVYLRGWSRLSKEHSVWEIDDPNYAMDAPAGLHGE